MLTTLEKPNADAGSDESRVRPRTVVLMCQAQFAPMVESGDKRRTIRPRRKRPVKMGDHVSLRQWTGKPYRSKQCGPTRGNGDARGDREDVLRWLLGGWPDAAHRRGGKRLCGVPMDSTALCRCCCGSFPDTGFPFTGDLIEWSNNRTSASKRGANVVTTAIDSIAPVVGSNAGFSVGDDAPIHILSLGAGRAKLTTLALMAAAGEVTPTGDAARHRKGHPCGTGKSVLPASRLAGKSTAFPGESPTRSESLIEDTTIDPPEKGRYRAVRPLTVPAFIANPDGCYGIIPRQCTVNLEIEPIRRRYEVALRDQSPLKSPSCSNQWIGISLEEIHRMKPDRNKWCENRWPLDRRRDEATRLSALA